MPPSPAPHFTVRGSTPLGLVYIVAPNQTDVYSLSQARFRELTNCEPQPGLSVSVELQGRYITAIAIQ